MKKEIILTIGIIIMSLMSVGYAVPGNENTSVTDTPTVAPTDTPVITPTPTPHVPHARGEDKLTKINQMKAKGQINDEVKGILIKRENEQRNELKQLVRKDRLVYMMEFRRPMNRPDVHELMVNEDPDMVWDLYDQDDVDHFCQEKGFNGASQKAGADNVYCVNLT